MKNKNIYYKSAVTLSVITPVLLFWLIGAVGILGASGNPADLMYIAVVLVEIVGAVICRLKPAKMVNVLFAAALTQVLVTIVAFIIGMHLAPNSSVGEILGLNGFFILMFITSALLFKKTLTEQQSV